jgi:3-hydroxyacyl-CoA dehydrogenase
VIGVHFVNPVQVLPLVELVGSLLTDEKTYLATEAFIAGTLGKQVIRSQDRAGFVVNALLIPYLLSAVRMLESGFATAADIDIARTNRPNLSFGSGRANNHPNPSASADNCASHASMSCTVTEFTTCTTIDLETSY